MLPILETFGEGDYVIKNEACCSKHLQMVFGYIRKKLQKGPPYVPLRINLSIRGLLIFGLLAAYTRKKFKTSTERRTENCKRLGEARQEYLKQCASVVL